MNKGWHIAACIVFIILAGWMGQLGAMWFCVSFFLVALIFFGLALLSYINGGTKFQDVDRRAITGHNSSSDWSKS